MKKDKKEIEAFFKDAYKELCIVSYQFVKNRHDAEDIVQDVFVYLINYDDSSTIQNLEAYTRRAVRNASLRKIERSRKSISIEEKDIDRNNFHPSDEKLIIAREERIFIHKQIDKMPTVCRKVFLMCVIDGMKYKEVAELHNVSVNTIKSQVKQAYKLLRISISEIYAFLFFYKKIKN